MLVAVLIGAIIAARIINDRLPDWVFALFLTGLAVSVALDIIAVWELHSIGRYATAALAAGMTLLVVVTVRGPIEILAAAGVLAVGLAVAMFLNAPVGGVLDGDWIAPQITAIAFAVLPAAIGVVIVEAFRRMVQVELDRVLTQSTVSAPRFAVGMLASEELARLDLAAEELLDSIATKKTPLPLAPKMASVAASLATELRLHLIEGRRETWLYHAVSESELLGKSVTLVDKSSLAGLLDPSQRDGLLSTAWLLVSDTTKANPATTVNVQIGPVEPPARRRRPTTSSRSRSRSPRPACRGIVSTRRSGTPSDGSGATLTPPRIPACASTSSASSTTRPINSPAPNTRTGRRTTDGHSHPTRSRR